MGTEQLDQAIRTSRDVLAAVQADQLTLPTPCTQWDVAQLINHLVGAQHFFHNGVTGAAAGGDSPDFASGDYLAEYDRASAAALAAFAEDGAMERTLTLPWGEMPGAAFMGMAVTDTLAHGWDLAKATGQSTDLAPELASAVLEQSRTTVPPGFRSEDGAIFGLEQDAPADATAADKLAAFLGRRV